MDRQHVDFKPYVREAGTGTPVLCLHSSAGSSKQWIPLMETLRPSYRVIAPDLYGYGKSPGWPNHRPLSLADEVALLEPVLKDMATPFHLIGHSYGGAVGLTLAATYPERIRSLIVYEPVLFNLLFEINDGNEGADQIKKVGSYVQHMARGGRRHEAARLFIDYWTGDDQWNRLPSGQQDAIAEKMEKVASDFDATFSGVLSLRDYECLRIPALLLYGIGSPISTLRISELLGNALPLAEMRGLGHLGHMGPVTHPLDVNRLIMQFLDWQRDTVSSEHQPKVA